MRALPAAFLILMFVFVPGCDDGEDPAPAPAAGTEDTASGEEDTSVADDTTPADTAGGDGAVDFAAVVDALTASCSGCHGAGGCSYPASCFLDNEDDMKADSIAPGCPEGSTIAECSLARIQDETMPPKGTKPAPTAEEVQVLQDWIDAN